MTMRKFHVAFGEDGGRRSRRGFRELTRAFPTMQVQEYYAARGPGRDYRITFMIDDQHIEDLSRWFDPTMHGAEFIQTYEVPREDARRRASMSAAPA